MGIGAKIFNMFRPKKDPTLTTKQTTLSELISSCFNTSYNAKDNITYSSIVNVHARHFSKTQMRIYKNGEETDEEFSKRLKFLLNYKPNPVQTASEFYQCVCKDYCYSTALIYIEHEYDNFKNPSQIKALWPVDYSDASFKVKESDGELLFKFTVDNKEVYATSREMIILTREVDSSELFGGQNPALKEVLNVISTSYQGVVKAIKTSAVIRFLITSSTPLQDSVKKSRADTFAKQFLDMENSSGVIVADSVGEVKQLNTPPKYSDAEEIQTFKKDIYEYLNCNPKILQGNYTEDEFQAYYETVIEPLGILLSQKLTNLIFDDEDIMEGYEIRFISDRLHTASLKTRIEIAGILTKLPVIKPNAVTDLLYLERLENGDKEYSTLNYTQSDKQNQYQLGEEGKEEEDNVTK